MAYLCIIPARYDSVRLPGKPLLDICGKSMIQHVYEKAKSIFEYVYIATDDNRICKAVSDFGGLFVLTSKNHINGTSRCLEATEIIRKKEGIMPKAIFNIQGDEPMLDIRQINDLIACIEKNPNFEIATLVCKVNNASDLKNVNECFVTMDIQQKALYFSRHPIPYHFHLNQKESIKKHSYYKHIGFYAYTYEALKQYLSLKPSSLELAESLEQNRWLENGRSIQLGITEHQATLNVDSFEELEKVRSLLKERLS